MVSTRPYHTGDWKGQVAASHEDSLPEIFDTLSKSHPRQVLKAGRARKIWVADSPIGPLCIKDFFYTKGMDRFLKKLRGSRAWLEWKRLVAFTKRGVPVPQPVLWGEKEGKGGSIRSVVITRFEENCLPLSEVLETKARFAGEQRRRITIQIGEALARMHAAGGRHDDLHAGNLMVQDNGETTKVFIVDLHQVAMKRSLPWNTRLKNLGRLLGGTQRFLTLTDKQRCLRAYLEALSDWKPPFPREREARRSMGKGIQIFAEKDFRKRWRRRLAKCTEEGKRFQRVRCGPYTGWIRAGWDVPGFLEVLTDPNGWIDSERCEVIKHTPSTTVARAAIEGFDAPLFVKRYNRKDLWERTKNLFRRSRAMKVWRSAYALELLGIPTPLTVCALEKRRGPLLLEAFLFTVWIEGGIGFDDFYRDRCAPDAAPPLNPKTRRALEKEVARLFRELHSHRISHGDLKGRNVLLNPKQPAPFEPQFVDLDAMTLAPLRFRRSRVNDLSRLLFSVYPIPSLRTQILFFREYSKGNPDLWKERRLWWRSIAKRTRRKLKEKGLIA